MSQKKVYHDTGLDSKPITSLLYWKQPIIIIHSCKYYGAQCHGEVFFWDTLYIKRFLSHIFFFIQSLRQTEKSTSYPPKDQIQEGHLMSGSGSIFNDFIQNDTRTLLPLKITYIVHILGHKVHWRIKLSNCKLIKIRSQDWNIWKYGNSFLCMR